MLRAENVTYAADTGQWYTHAHNMASVCYIVSEWSMATKSNKYSH